MPCLLTRLFFLAAEGGVICTKKHQQDLLFEATLDRRPQYAVISPRHIGRGPRDARDAEQDCDSSDGFLHCFNADISSIRHTQLELT